MIEIETTEERQSIATSRLRLSFQWTGDRWSHCLQRNDSSTPLAASVESDPSRDDLERVVSPAYQQLGWQRRDSAVQALLVGQNGTHHSSAVFSVKERGEDVLIEVDIADRCRSETPLLACTYRVDARSGDLLPSGPSAVGWKSAVLGILEVETEGSGRLALAEAGRSATLVQILAPVVPATFTQRFSYRWRWASANQS